MSVRNTAAGAVAIALLAFLTAPVSACDERFIKKCEKAAAAAAAASEAADAAPVAKRKAAKRVLVVASRGAKHSRLVKRTRAPGFAVRPAGMSLASAESRPASPPESAMARRFRGFIDPRPIALNAFEVWRKPHIAAINLEPPDSAPVIESAEVAPEPAPAPVQAAPVAAAKQDRVAPRSAAMELASAESRPVVLPELPRHGAVAAASMVPVPAAQPVVSEAPAVPSEPQPSRFGFHQLVIALCGALGAAGALRFIVGA